jgi:ribosomal protein S18 acetylase RimI-like enzyme
LSLLAVADGQAVGFVTNAEDEAAPGQNGYIIQVGVHPQWRGQRLGATLITRSLLAWQAEGKEVVILHVNSNNPEAIRLYQQLGFVVVRRRGKFRLQSEAY